LVRSPQAAEVRNRLLREAKMNGQAGKTVFLGGPARQVKLLNAEIK
jgi:hypothetical protein